MGFGVYCPLPLRLGGSPTEGWAPAQHARLANDVATLKRVAPFCVMTLTPSGGGTTLHTYRGRNGVGPGHAPTILRVGAGEVRLTWPQVYEDEFGIGSHATNVTSVRVGVHGTTYCKFSHNIDSANQVTVYTADSGGTPEDRKFTLTVTSSGDDVTAMANTASIGEYDGDLDKRASSTEGDIPYAWVWYRELQSMRGSAYSSDPDSLVAVENRAIARSEAGRSRAGEKLYTNSVPATADERLEYWLEVQNVPQRLDEPRWRLRRRCAAKFRTATGPTRSNVDEGLEKLLGPAYVKSWRQVGVDLATPPTQTYWPTANPGPTSYDLGGGAWFSERSHLVVEVQQPESMSDTEFLYMVNVELFEYLDQRLPAWSTFNWAMGVSVGFRLDIDRMDYTGMT